MPAKDLGLKHTCWKCGAKFYDLKKAEPACPKCGADPRDAPAVKAPPAERRRPVREEPPLPEVDGDESGTKEDLEESDEELEDLDDDE